MTQNPQRQAAYSCRYRVYTFIQLKAATHAVKLNHKTGCLKSANHIILLGWRNYILTKVGINTICAAEYSLLKLSASHATADFHFSTVHHAQLHHALNAEGVNMLFVVCFSDSMMWHFHSRCERVICGPSPLSSPRLMHSLWLHFTHKCKSFPGLLSSLLLIPIKLLLVSHYKINMDFMRKM